MENLDLSKFFQTKTQAIDFSKQLALISEKIYNTNFDLEKTLIDQLGLKKKDAFISLLHENKIDTKSSSALKAFFSTLQEQLAALPVISLTMAFEPKEKTLKSLSDWFIFNMNRQILFDITVNQELIGGAAINFKGKFMDFSIRPTFDQIVEEVLSPKKTDGENKKVPSVHQDIEHMSI